MSYFLKLTLLIWSKVRFLFQKWNPLYSKSSQITCSINFLAIRGRDALYASNKRCACLVLAIKLFWNFNSFIFLFIYSKPSSSYALRSYNILHLVVLPSLSDLNLWEPILFVCVFFFKLYPKWPSMQDKLSKKKIYFFFCFCLFLPRTLFVLRKNARNVQQCNSMCVRGAWSPCDHLTVCFLAVTWDDTGFDSTSAPLIYSRWPSLFI